MLALHKTTDSAGQSASSLAGFQLQKRSPSMLFRVLIFVSLFPIAIALVIRWWFGIRVLASEGKRACRCDLKRWLPEFDDTAIVHRAEESASEFGRQLRSKALTAWKEDDPKAAASREGSRRFGLAVPPLSAMVAIFAVLVGKIPVTGAIAIFFGATALAAVFGLLSVAPELRAIARAANRARKERNFPNSYDEEAVIACAVAHAWDLSLPPVIRWVHK